MIKQRKNKKIAIVIAILIITIIISLTVLIIQKANKKEVITINNNIGIIENMLANEIIKDQILQEKYCEYSTNGNGTISIQAYFGTEESLVIPEKINNYEIQDINADAFKSSEELEMIKIPVKIGKNIKEIQDFQKSEKLTDEEYIVYITTKTYNEQYIEYMKLSQEEKAERPAIPRKFKNPLKKTDNVAKSKEATVSAIPSSYDLRNKITIPVKNQGPLAICYAFATLNCLETNIALKTGEYVDFSEIHGAVRSRQGAWGNFLKMDRDYFALGDGPVVEQPGTLLDMDTILDQGDAISRYIYKYCVSDTSITEEQLQSSISRLGGFKQTHKVMDHIVFPSVTEDMKADSSYATAVEENRNNIKKHIMTNGSLYVLIPNTKDYNICRRNNGYMVMKSTKSNSTAHTINIIGWDDNFSASNFPDSMGVTTNGAWLALNSYGSSWGNNGTFWISYEDNYIEDEPEGVTSVTTDETNIQNATIRLSQTSYTYDGSYFSPAVTVTYGGNTLRKRI